MTFDDLQGKERTLPLSTHAHGDSKDSTTTYLNAIYEISHVFRPQVRHPRYPVAAGCMSQPYTKVLRAAAMLPAGEADSDG